MENQYRIGQPLLILRGNNKHANRENKVPVFGCFKEIVDESIGVPKKYASKYKGGSLSLECPLRLQHPAYFSEKGIYVPIVAKDLFNPYILKNIIICKTLEEALSIFDGIGKHYREGYEHFITRLFK